MSETCIYEMQKIKAQKMHFIYKKKKNRMTTISKITLLTKHNSLAEKQDIFILSEFLFDYQ